MYKRQIGDKLWGIPYGDMSISMVIYNKTLFDELGLAAPETYDELLEIANTLKEHDASIMPMLHMGKMPMFWPMWFMETYAQTSGNNSLDNVYKFLGRERQFTGAEEQEAFEKVKAFYDDGILSAETFDTDVQGLVAAFAPVSYTHLLASSFGAPDWTRTSGLPGRRTVTDRFKWRNRAAFG